MRSDLLAMLVCPKCHGALDETRTASGGESHEHRLRCGRCDTRYPVRSGLPILLVDEGMSAEDLVRRGARTNPVASRPPLQTVPDLGRRLAALPVRVTRARNVMRNQGLLPFVQKAWRAGRTEAERRLPPLRRGSVFVCPCCESRERFVSYRGRPYAQCPGCGAKERDRLLVLILRDLLEHLGPRTVLHASPEATIRPFLDGRVSSYFAVDLTRGLSSYAGQLSAAADLTRLPFAENSFDLVLASHVLEHIPDDRAAIREVHRVLKPGGTAILPVPIVHGGATVEYGEARADEEMHVRAPGLDYFDRFEEGGFQVVARRSSDFSTSHQLHSFHSHWDDIGGAPGAKPGMPGLSGMEQYVPVCTKPGAVGERYDSFPAREHV